MTDRHAGYLVTLANDMREDDAEAVMTALRMVRGVISVEPVQANIDQMIAMGRVNAEWTDRLFDLLRHKPTGDGRD